MYTNRYVCVILFIVCIVVVTTVYTLFPKPKAAVFPSIPSESIILDLTGMVFKENKAGFAKKIGYATLTSYTLSHWKNPGHTCLDMLDKISSSYENQKPVITIKLQGRTMPRSLAELHQGIKNCEQAKTEVLQCIEDLDQKQYFKSKKEKKLMVQMISLIFDPQEIVHLTEPVKSTVTLIKKLKKTGYKIYVVGNAPQELYIPLQEKHTDIFTLFDGAIISSQVKMIKPDETIFNHLITTYNLSPRLCILIDDQEESRIIAEKLGMKTIAYDKLSAIPQKLKSIGIQC